MMDTARLRWPAQLSVAGGASRRTAWLVIVALVIALLLAMAAIPLSEAIARTREDVARSRSMVDIAKARAAESATLARAAPSMRVNDERTAIDRVMSLEGLHYQRGSVQSDGAASVVLADAGFDALVRALDRLAREESMHVVDAVITARVEPGHVRAELMLRR